MIALPKAKWFGGSEQTANAQDHLAPPVCYLDFSVNNARPPVFRTIEISDPQFETDNLRHVTVKSPALGRRADITVHATQRAHEVSHAPLVILLHGIHGSHWAWTQKAGAHRLNEALQLESTFPNFVLAMPSDGLWGDGSGYVAHHGQDFERWIVDEVPAAVAHAVPSITSQSKIFIAGLSMGGFGALRLASEYPERFAGASAHSAITELAQLRDLIHEDITLDAAPSVLASMLKNRERLSPFRFDCGFSDSLINANRALSLALMSRGIAHRYEEFAGDHSWSYWGQHLERSLRFFAEVLAMPAAETPAELNEISLA
ncbi:MAG TPA: alpha/beta fold hydrolase [Opitutaceae bacterium]